MSATVAAHGREAWPPAVRGMVWSMRGDGGILVRPAAPDDAAAIALIQVRSWQAAHRSLFPDPFLDGLSVDDRTVGWADALSRPPTGDHTLVAENDGLVVGFAHVGPVPEVEPAARPGTGQVHALYVDPARWGRGVGRSLMAAGLAALRDDGFADASLWVLEANAHGRHFYEAGGWAPDRSSRTEWIGGVATALVRYGVSLRDEVRPDRRSAG